MALEFRGNNLYYYRKRRVGGRVISEYAGKGESALLYARWDQLQKDEDIAQHESRNRERDLHLIIDEVMKAFCDEASALEKALLLLNGYHLHSRQWRQRAK